MGDPGAGRWKRRILLVLVILLLLAAVAAVLLVSAAREAAHDWPALDTPPVSLPAPPIKVDAEALPLFYAALAAAKDIDGAAFTEALDVEGSPPDAKLEVWRDHAAALEALEALLAHPGLGLPVQSLDEEPPSMLTAMALGRLLLLRAWWQTEQGAQEAAVADLERALRLGLILEHAGGSLLVTMVGLAVQGMTIDETLEMLAVPPKLQGAALAPLEARLQAAAAWPQGIVAGLAAECLSGEELWESLRGMSVSEILEASPMDGARKRSAPAAGEQRASDSWLLNVDKTRAFARRDCAKRLQRLQIARPTRPPLERIELWRDGFRPGQYVDNPVGRILLTIASPSFESFTDRSDTLRARRRLLLTRMALLRFGHDHDGNAPATLTDLVPDYLPAVPQDPYSDAALRYDLEQRCVSSAGAELDSVDREQNAKLSIRF